MDVKSVDIKGTANAAKGLVGEFKEFISRGNVVDMAVGIIVGSAFTSIVNSLVKDVITPFIAWIIGDTDFTSMALVLVPANGDDPGISIAYGNFIQQIVNFLIIAFVVFMMVKVINRFRRKKEEAPAPAPEPPKPSPELEVLQEIRDLLSAEKN